MSSNIKPLIALGLTAAGTAVVASFQVADPSTIVAVVPTAATAAAATETANATSATSATSESTSSGTASATATSSPSPATQTAASASYADGTYTGASVSEPWGTFQVQATISGGQLTAVSVVAAPGDRHSSSINSQAVPLLTQETLAAQSADIDMLSGATWTSRSYITSLQAALDDAAAAQQSAG